MKQWTDVLIFPSTSIVKALKIIDEGALQIALVVDENNRLLGTVTDGDVRRGILKGITLDEPVRLIMNNHPTVAQINESREDMLAVMKQKRLRHIPVLDRDGTVIKIEILDDLIKLSQLDNWVVLMAGGLGSRLRPLTNDCPKPLLQVGSKPILETILQNFIDNGFSNFYIAVNFKAEMIKKHFGNGSRWGVKILYLHEKQKLGTAGALSLLPKKPNKPLLVMNGDLLTKVNFHQLLDFHQEQQAHATMCVREYDLQVPYGVVKIHKNRLIGIDEKPVQRFFVNAGIYVLNPGTLDYIPKNCYYDMPNLFERLIRQRHETAVFPIREYWLDIGQTVDYEKANGEFLEVFG